jgi:hypothetical protein
MVGKAFQFDAAERSAELPADTQAIGNGTGKGRAGAKGKKQKTETTEAKSSRTKHTYATEDDVFEWLELVAIARKCDLSDLVNNALWSYLPRTVTLRGALITRPPRKGASEETDTTAGTPGSNGHTE